MQQRIGLEKKQMARRNRVRRSKRRGTAQGKHEKRATPRLMRHVSNFGRGKRNTRKTRESNKREATQSPENERTKGTRKEGKRGKRIAKARGIDYRAGQSKKTENQQNIFTEANEMQKKRLGSRMDLKAKEVKIHADVPAEVDAVVDKARTADEVANNGVVVAVAAEGQAMGLYAHEWELELAGLQRMGQKQK